MEMKSRLAFAAVCAVCIIFGLSCTVAAIDVPAKLIDIPLYQGSKVEQAMDMQNHSMVTLKVNAKPEDIAVFYKSAMEGKGWKTLFQAEQEGVRVINFQKDNQMLQLSIHTEKKEDATTVNLVLTSQ